MRKSGDLWVYTSLTECKAGVGIRPRTVKKRRTKSGYLDITATLDIEVTARELDGFLYTIQFCIGGQCALLRYAEDFLGFLDHLVEEWDISPERRLVIYVHNLGYEFFHLGQILAGRYGVQSALHTSSHKPLYIRYENGLEIRDSLKLFQKSLARATEGLPHEKLSGDLNYNMYRTPDTPLSPDEWNYCINDVMGLYEAIERLKSYHGYDQARLPLTNTAIVIDQLNKHIRGDGETMKAMRELTLTRDQMELAYRAMAGGDTHGCRWKAGRVYKGCNSVDLKSAHPSQQLLKPFPCGEPIDMYGLKEDDLNGLVNEGYGWIAELSILDMCVKDECPDPTISVSKCLAIEDKGEVDNGRLCDCAGAVITMDSNDWQRFKEAYDYSYVEARYVVAFPLAPLPKRFREGILEKFRIKESGITGPDYDFSKICINTIFGACAQKVVRDEYDVEALEEGISANKTKWQDKIQKMDDKEVAKKQKMKFPFLWGLWTSSLSRLALWDLLKAVGWERVIYWDTDSCKYEGKKCKAVESYNAKVVALNKEAGVDVVNPKKGPVYIGVAEDEFPGVEYGYKEFTFLHSKCYAALAWDKKAGSYQVATTIAGVGKAEGRAAMDGDISNLKYGLTINPAGGNKVTYCSRPVFTRTDFNRPTLCASYVYMEPREYEVRGNTIEDKIELLEMEIIVE